MKEEIETTHFEHTFAVLGTNRAAESHSSTKQVEVLCVSPQPVSHGFYRVMSVKFLFFVVNEVVLWTL